jgi:sigma-B regulation protein RsbU (phosphoserine phosphatase)
MFVTLFCAAFDLKTGGARYASAGHPSPVFLRPGQDPSCPFDSTGMMVGLMTDTKFEGRALDWRPGDALVFFTDGVTEAFDATGRQFGEPRLLEHLAAAAGRSAAETTAGALGAVRGHAGGQPQSDDITILVVRYAGP